MKGAQGVASHVASSSVRLAMIFIFANKTSGDTYCNNEVTLH